MLKKNKDKLFKDEKIRPYNFVIQPQQRADLKYVIDLILDFNEELNQIWFECNSIENIKIKK